MNSAPPFGVSMYPVPTSATATTNVEAPTNPISFATGAEVEVSVEGIMDYNITTPEAVE